MKVLFLKDVPGVALGGEVKEVKNGYARNYLIPYNIAVLANNESLKHLDPLFLQFAYKYKDVPNNINYLGSDQNKINNCNLEILKFIKEKIFKLLKKINVIFFLRK